MRALLEPLEHSEEFQKLKMKLAKAGKTTISAGADSDRTFLMNALSGNFGVRLVITHSERRAEELYEDFRFYSRDVFLYPAKDILFYSADIHGNSIVRRRMDIYRHLLEQEKCTIVLTVDALFDRIPDLSYLSGNVIEIAEGEELDVEAFKARLVELGYEKSDKVDGVGQFAVRGGLIDIFPLTEMCPYRIDLWDTEIDTIRSFDVESQRSIERVSKLKIYPASEMVMSERRMLAGVRKIDKEFKAFYEELRKEFKTEESARLKRNIETFKENLLEYNAAIGVDSYVNYFYSKTVSLLDIIGENAVVFLDEEPRINAFADEYMATFAESMESRLKGGYILPGMEDVLFTYDEILAKLDARTVASFADAAFTEFAFNSRKVVPYKNNFEMLLSDVAKWQGKGYSIVFVSPSETRARRMVSNLMDNDVVAFFSNDHRRKLEKREVMVTTGRLRVGFEFPDLKLVVVSEGDVFTARTHSGKRKKSKSKYAGEVVKSFQDLSVGDYVVHENYGVGIYGGLEKVQVEGVSQDYMTINYQGGGKLYVLASEMDAIQKLSDKDGRKPKLNKLGGAEWQKTRNRVQGHVSNVAKELVTLYAKRQASQGFMYQPDTPWQMEFEEMFPYEETEDQKNAIAETKADMESHKIMDRLICGDVGFGKTEIAIRAAFKAVIDGRQVAYLVPTTVLAQQHFTTFVDRMKDFPVEVRMLSRFCTTREMKQTLEDVAMGKVDIVIGTHRLLSKDVSFAKLGLLIIDEEQRFGVTHKEKIKQLKTNVDVLTLTATPIPRTLHMSLIGIRDMSVLTEPPVDRRAIQTYVMELDDELVREAIKRELARNGQVYYVYNRVKNIEEMAHHVAELVPDAVVEYAHGQMTGRELEDIMYRFVSKEIDVLVTTTIIETGLDIPNANTMIVHDADTFGLAQLYQLRGRVGRSDRSAYAFLMYRRDKLIRETAEKRLSAIREFTDLGSGIKISMRDLEIRGAGNILGSDQSGHMEAVGYDLYCKMLNDAIKTELGEETEERFETSVSLPFDAFIPSDYIRNEFIKLDFYKRISRIKNPEDYEDIIDELVDRFGEIPPEAQNLLDMALLKANANKAYITGISKDGRELKFAMYQNAKINVDGIGGLLEKYNGKLKFHVTNKPAFVYKENFHTPEDIWRGAKEIVEAISGLAEE